VARDTSWGLIGSREDFNTGTAIVRGSELGKVTFKSNSDEVLSDESLLKSNGDEPFRDYSL
jgi:hypothetical protein